MEPSKRITVLLADDHAVVRKGLRRLLDSECDIKVIGEASTGRQAVAMSRELAPSVILMDIAMPNLNGMEAARQILKKSPETRILFLSAHGCDVYIEKAICMGAAGFLSKQESAQKLFSAIREINNGHTAFSPVIDNEQHPAHDAQQLEHYYLQLTPREAEVLQLVAEGEANKQIAAELDISIKTVEKHRDHLMHKLDIHDTAGLTRYAIETGVIESRAPLDMA
ncbi:MAG: response regulator transcription factor [Kiritimatiellales bacterium]|nr:response regulator transcription factor [Kiritimatiellota bacterium]MBL7012728.1 response regulator transcription factor [Kiritimatiellales bacterium]